MAKKALITGITGQDGSYLAELLLEKGYEVHGLIRKSSTFNTGRIDHLYQDPHESGVNLFLHYGDLVNLEQVSNLVYNVRPEEIYHLGAQSHVQVSFDSPEYTGEVTALGSTRLLEAVRRSGIGARVYQASSSEMFGASPPPQNEGTPFAPRSPYAAAKVYAYWMAVNYREGSGMFAANGILFNHESPRRGETFVTRKVTRAVARNPRRAAAEGVSRQPRLAPRLGLRPGVRRGDVAHPAAGRAGRLRDRHGRVALGAGVRGGGVRLRGARLEGARRDRLPVLPAHGT